MPVIKLPNGKYRWGQHGKEYPTRAGAERQMAAAYFAGYKEKKDGKDSQDNKSK